MDTFTWFLLSTFLGIFTIFAILKLYFHVTRTQTIVVNEDYENHNNLHSTNHLFVSNTPHTYSQIYVDESSNVRSVTITRISPHTMSTPIVGYMLDASSLIPIRPNPPTYEDSIKSTSPPKNGSTSETNNSTTRSSMELPTSSATTARADGSKSGSASSERRSQLLPMRSLSDSWAVVERIEQVDDVLKSAR